MKRVEKSNLRLDEKDLAMRLLVDCLYVEELNRDEVANQMFTILERQSGITLDEDASVMIDDLLDNMYLLSQILKG